MDSRLVDLDNPKKLQPETCLTEENGIIDLATARNDPLVNSFNPMLLISWRPYVDMQYCFSQSKN